MQSVELLDPDKVTELWVQLEPILQEACEGNETAVYEITPLDIFGLVHADLATVFVMWEEGVIKCVLVVQFGYIFKHKYADILALAGSKLMLAKGLAWEAILDWFRANEVEFVDARTNPRFAKILQSKFGFTDSSVQVRMRL